MFLPRRSLSTLLVCCYWSGICRLKPHNTGHVANQYEIIATIEHVLHQEPVIGESRLSALMTRMTGDES